MPLAKVKCPVLSNFRLEFGVPIAVLININFRDVIYHARLLRAEAIVVGGLGSWQLLLAAKDRSNDITEDDIPRPCLVSLKATTACSTGPNPVHLTWPDIPIETVIYREKTDNEEPCQHELLIGYHGQRYGTALLQGPWAWWWGRRHLRNSRHQGRRRSHSTQCWTTLPYRLLLSRILKEVAADSEVLSWSPSFVVQSIDFLTKDVDTLPLLWLACPTVIPRPLLPPSTSMFLSFTTH